MINTNRLREVLDTDVVTALADDNGDGTADTGVLEAALTAAEQEVKAALRASGWPASDTLDTAHEDLAVTLAVERLFLRRREMEPGSWQRRFEEVRTLLDDIARGRRSPSEPAAQNARILQTPEGIPPLHRRGTLKGF